MNTPVHLIMGAAAFGKRDMRAVTWAAIAGGFLPDLSLFAMAGVSIFLLGYPPQQVFGEFYYSSAWQQVIAVDNSFVLWGVAFGLALWRKVPGMIAFCGAAFLHLVFDFPLHNHDARMHFWPLTDWKFISPVSYWEGARGGNLVAVAEVLIVAVLGIYLLIRHSDIWLRVAFTLLMLMQIAPFVIWRLVF